MKIGMKFLTVIFILLAISIQQPWVALCEAGSNILKPIEWRSPWIHPPVREYFAFNNFHPRQNGFEITVTKSEPNICFYGIQVISNNYVMLNKGKYRAHFNAYSSSDGQIYFNIQSDNNNNPNFVLPTDKIWTISANLKDGDFIKLNHEFAVDKRTGGLLHFKIGELPPNTLLKIKDIRIEEID